MNHTLLFRSTLIFLAISCFGSLHAQERKLVLVEDGVSRAPIVLFDGAPPYTRQAADELAVYMEKISGARPKVIEGEPDSVPKHGIWVGFQPKVAKLFPEIDFTFG